MAGGRLGPPRDLDSSAPARLRPGDRCPRPAAARQPAGGTAAAATPSRRPPVAAGGRSLPPVDRGRAGDRRTVAGHRAGAARRGVHAASPRLAAGPAVRQLRAGPPAAGGRAVRPLLPAVADPAGHLRGLRRVPPVHFADRCERCKRRAAARAGRVRLREAGRAAVVGAAAAATRVPRGHRRLPRLRDLTKLESGLARPAGCSAGPTRPGPAPGRAAAADRRGRGGRSCQLAARAARALGKRARARRPGGLPPAVRPADHRGLRRLRGPDRCLAGGARRAGVSAGPIRPGRAPGAGGSSRSARPGHAGPSGRRASRPGAPQAGPASRRPPAPSPAAGPPLDALISYGQARGWAPARCAMPAARDRRAGQRHRTRRATVGRRPARAVPERRNLVALRAVEFFTDQGLPAVTRRQSSSGGWRPGSRLARAVRGRGAHLD